MATVTITQTDSPSRSKMAGPCWIAIGDVYASTRTRSVETDKPTITVTGKVMLRRATRNETQRETWTLTVTGNPDDKVTLRLGGAQYVEAELTGVTETA